MLEFIVIVISFIGLILQSSFFDYFSLMGVKPDIPLTSIVMYAIFKGPKKGAILGGIIGLIEDLFIGHFIGPMVISRILLGIGVGFFSRNMYRESLFVAMFILFISTFLSNAFLWLFFSIANGYLSWIFFIKISVLQGIYNQLFMPILYFINHKISLKEK